MSFTLTFLGSSGGPLEGSTCATLIKPADVSYADIIGGEPGLICVDAGSGINLLAETIYSEQHGAASPLLNLYPDSKSISAYVKAPVVTPFTGINNPFGASRDIFSRLKHYLISHPHLDHIAALAINSAGFAPPNAKTVYGSLETVSALEDHIFNGLIWPNMPKYNILHLDAHPFWKPFVCGDWDVTMLDLSHGKLLRNLSDELEPFHFIRSHLHHAASDHHYHHLFHHHSHLDIDVPEDLDHYSSLAFLLHHRRTNSSLLVFGDFELDCVSMLDKNKRIWRHIAPMVVDASAPLRGIVLECSLALVSSIHELYGHLMPQHLIQELKVLEQECRNHMSAHVNGTTRSPLHGLNVIITHVKEPLVEDTDPRLKVLEQLEALNEEHGFGIRFSVALSGVSIEL